MMVVIQIAAADDAKAWSLLLRHSPGTALPNRTYVVNAHDNERAITLRSRVGGQIVDEAAMIPAREVDWPTLKSMLATDPRLQLGG